jgi:hypothetical protein
MSLVISKVFTYDTDAGDYIQRVEGASGDNQALEPATRQAINNFVIGCKQDGIWNAIKASCILSGARTLAGALQPLVGTAPTNNGFIGLGTDYVRKTGLVGNGTKFLNSNRNNNADPQNSKHLAIYATTATSSLNQAYAQVSYGTGFTAINTVNSTTLSININCDSLDIPTINAPGFLGGNRSASNIQQGRGGGITNTNSTSSQLPRNENIRIFNAGAPRLAFYSIGESLDLALLDARVTALITAFGVAIP